MVSGPIDPRAPMRVSPAQEGRRLDRRVRADPHADLDQGRGGIDDRHPRVLVRLDDPLLGEPRDVGQVHAVVDAEGDRGIGQDMRPHGPAGRAQRGQDVREVRLALGGARRERLQGGEQRAGVEQVQARVDLADRHLRLGGVAGHLRLDHAVHAAAGVPHHAAVAARVGELHRRDRRPRVAVTGDQRLDRLGGEQRHVAVDDERRCARIDQAGGGHDGAAGAVGLGLHGDLDALGQVRREPPVRVVDDDHARGAGLLGGLDRPQKHRPSADRVQDLGQGGAHPGALARREDDHCGCRHRGEIVVSAGASRPSGVV